MAVKVWRWLGTPGSVRAITAGMLVYALILGGLIVGYSRVTACLTDLGDVDAVATTKRAQAAAEDREAAIELGRQLADGEQADVRRAARTWIDTQARNDKVRAQYPPPAPPSAVC